ncbi:PAP2 superfamily protein [Lysobacter silvestris]|uniref:undecaprenyl-diphosphate phosphatase n=2 Tax=Solilutibacter silvestris TaxID=1645665 RepID=A0A2K1PYT7_9GAMM|nr:PAP2 superfamily protein [Lysobacter silvestris]
MPPAPIEPTPDDASASSFLRRHGWRIALLFVAVLLPLWGFGELADEVGEGGTFAFDRPILEWLHAHHAPLFDQLALLFSRLGYQYGVIPFDIALVVWLAFRHRRRAAVFATIAIVGSALLNVATKHYYGRARPSLWESLAPETTFSFPSGHAMGSMTLAAVLVLLAWNTRWRWMVAIAASAFVLVVGTSRLYLGVHYPSDILGGWAAALAWTLGVYAVLFGMRRDQRFGR